MRTPAARTSGTSASPGPGWPRVGGPGALALSLLVVCAGALAAWAGEAASPRSPAADEAAREAEIARQQRLQEAKVLAERGRKLVGAGAYGEARAALTDALRLNPADAASRKLLTQAEEAIGIPKGQNALANARERYVFKAQVLRQQIELDLFEAEKALKEQDYPRAAQQAERALTAAGQVEDAGSAAELRERAGKLLADARAANASATAARRQKELDAAKAQVAAERVLRTREEAGGLRALRDQGLKFLETKEYDKAQAIADEMLRAAPGNREALSLRDKIREATAAASVGPRSTSRQRREGEQGLLADVEREMTPLKPNVVIAANPNKKPAGRLLTGPVERWELELRSKLAAPVAIEFKETPLSQAIEQLASVGGVNIILDPEAGAGQVPVTLPRARMPLESVLRWVTRFGKLQYCLRDGAVLLTGQKGLLDEPVTRMYEIAALLSAPTTAEPIPGAGPVEPGPRPWQVVEATPPDPEPIGRGWVEFIKSTVAPQTWERGDALQAQQPYTIQYRNGRIVVVHVPEVQAQIDALLRDFRKSRTLQVSMMGRFISIEKKYLDSLNISFTANNVNAGEDTTHNASMSPSTEVSPLAEFDSFGPTGGLGVRYSILDDNSLVLLLKAVMNEGKGTVLESPRLACYNTQRANIQVLRNRNYVRRVSSDFTPEIGNIPEGTIFDIQPFVSADRRYITLVCQPQMRTFVSFTTFTYGIQTVQVSDTDTLDLTMTIQLPTTTLRSIGTTVTVPNGGTIVMGGFTNVQEQTGLSTSPFIEGIPLLRHILRGRDHIEGRRSLILLISAETVEDIFEEEQ